MTNQENGRSLASWSLAQLMLIAIFVFLAAGFLGQLLHLLTRNSDTGLLSTASGVFSFVAQPIPGELLFMIAILLASIVDAVRVRPWAVAGIVLGILLLLSEFGFVIFAPAESFSALLLSPWYLLGSMIGRIFFAAMMVMVCVTAYKGSSQPAAASTVKTEGPAQPDQPQTDESAAQLPAGLPAAPQQPAQQPGFDPTVGLQWRRALDAAQGRPNTPNEPNNTGPTGQ